MSVESSNIRIKTSIPSMEFKNSISRIEFLRSSNDMSLNKTKRNGKDYTRFVGR